jgi:nucleoside-diphosphate-sugar epimerase
MTAQKTDRAETAYLKDIDRVLIVGGTGFIGRHLAGRCLSDTPHVTCLSLVKNNPINEKTEALHADIGDREQLKSVLHSRGFDYVFNLGGYIDHAHYFKGGRRLIESHFIGLLNLIDCLDTGSLKGFVQIGSSDEYGDSHAPQKETMREMPISSYSFAKTAAAQFIQMLFRTEGFPGVVLRFFLVYGPGQDDKRFLPQIIKGCLRGEEFKTSEGGQLRDFCYIDDAVDAMIKAVVTQEVMGRVINIASGSPVTIKEIIEKIMSLAGGGKPVWGAHPYRKGESMELYADISLAKSLLGWEPSIPLDEGLRKTIEYYRQFRLRD